MTDELTQQILREDHSAQDWVVPILMGCFSLLSYAWFAFGVQAVEAGQPVAIVFPPTWDRHDAFLASATFDVDIMATGHFDFVTIVNPRNDHALDQLRAAGALFLMKSNATQLCAGGDTGNT